MPRSGVKWDHRYLNMARQVASWSKDPSTKCGAVIVSPDNAIVSLGFNGFPPNVKDHADRLNDRDTKLMMTLHAETNAILFAKQSLKDCTIYTWPMQACSQCAAMMIQAGITQHVSVMNENDRWAKSWELADLMLNEAGVTQYHYHPSFLERNYESI